MSGRSLRTKRASMGRTSRQSEEPQKAADELSRGPHVTDYFKREWKLLCAVTVSGIVYNVGMTAGPWFEGQLAQRLCDIITNVRQPSSMLPLALAYVAVIAMVQAMRFIKRLSVRTFSNNINRRMKTELYANLLNKSQTEVEAEGVGSLMTKAVADVDDCAEGMRKFTTEVFDTGVVLVAYTAMLLAYDWRLALIALCFPPVSYLIALNLRKRVTTAAADAKASMGRLNAATLDRTAGALTYRAFGLEQVRDQAYEQYLKGYERAAVRANTLVSALKPLYKAVSLGGVALIIILGARNVLGGGWTAWDIAAFTTFMSCFEKLTTKSSTAAKLFNAVQKAQVSWRRIAPYLGESNQGAHPKPNPPEVTVPGSDTDSATPWPAGALCPVAPDRLEVSHLAVSYGGSAVLRDVSFSCKPGQIAGITGEVACGKSTLGRALIGEAPLESGQIHFGRQNLLELIRSDEPVVGYLGHDPELISDTVAANVCMGAAGDVSAVLKAVSLDEEVAALPQGVHTRVGDRGTRLSGGQQARLGLARTLFHPRALLVLDDPLSAVDQPTEMAIFRQLRAYVASTGCAILLISHRLSLFPLLDSVVYLQEGRSRQGTHQSLMASCTGYSSLYRLQSAPVDLDGEEASREGR